MKAVTFYPEHNGELMIEWANKHGGYNHVTVDTRKLSKSSFKRMIRWIVISGQWYLNLGLDAYGEEYGYGTVDRTDFGTMPSSQIARWLIRIRNR